MVTFDFSPYYRSTIGFDRMAQLLEHAARVAEIDSGYPPYNIEAVGEDHYRVTIAVAGFAESELDVQVRENTLYVAGEKADEAGDMQYLHRGIAGRSFRKQFRLADHVRVEDAWLDNGLLTIDLVRELPEAMKPRRIEIATGAPKSLVSKAKKLLGGEAKAA
jgi:molecular chaperone IbpA